MGLGRQPLKHHPLLSLLQHQEPGAPAPAVGVEGRGDGVSRILPLQTRQQGLAGPVQEADGQGNHQGFLVGLAGCGRGVLVERQLQTAVASVPVPLNPQHRRAGLVVPTAKAPEVESRPPRILSGGTAGRRIFHGTHEVFAGGGAAVMAGHIEGHTALEAVLAEQGVEHPNQLGPLFIDGGGIKIINCLITVRLNRVRSGTGVFAELRVAQHRHIFDPIQRFTVLIGTEALVTKNGEPLLERELKPIAAGDAIAGPVMEVFVGDNTFHALQFRIGGRFGIGEHELGVKDIQTFILHSAHVEMAHGNDVVLLQVVFQSVHLFIPGHAAL